jgi:hypothetical protein
MEYGIERGDVAIAGQPPSRQDIYQLALELREP